jgi:hypothetical protein
LRSCTSRLRYSESIAALSTWARDCVQTQTLWSTAWSSSCRNLCRHQQPGKQCAERGRPRGTRAACSCSNLRIAPPPLPPSWHNVGPLRRQRPPRSKLRRGRRRHQSSPRRCTTSWVPGPTPPRQSSRRRTTSARASATRTTSRGMSPRRRSFRRCRRPTTSWRTQRRGPSTIGPERLVRACVCAWLKLLGLAAGPPPTEVARARCCSQRWNAANQDLTAARRHPM